jgi:predicted metal-binding membrane protein
MFTIDRLRALFRHTAPFTVTAAAALLAAGCASASANTAKTSVAASSASSSASSSMSGMNMNGMNMSSADMSAASAGGVNPVPTQVLGTADWQGMKITAEAMTAVPFLIYNGTTMQKVNPPKNVSFHLMVMLNDAQTGVVIPYASVWATISQGSKTLFDDSLWPMISRYMGPHYGNNVILNGTGTYKATLLISPPVSARHIEYENVWLTSHKVTFTFHWKSPS